MPELDRHRRLFVAVLALLVVGIAFRLPGDEPPRSPDPRFPRLAYVDRDLERALRKAWPRERFGEEAKEERAAFRKLARAHGADAARAIFGILVEACRGATGGDSYGQFSEDEEREAPAWMLGELADDTVRAMMVRALPLRDFHPSFRRALAVALCRPGSDIEPLLERVLDRQEENLFRERILLRLPRLQVPAPQRLRELLYQPFGYLDVHAAATLARMGDLEAPSLVLEGFDFSGRVDSESLHHLVLATEKFTGEKIAFNPTATVSGRMTRGRYDDWRKERAARHKAVLAAWMEGREPDTAFERARRAYLASDQRRRETILKSFEDVLGAGDDFDLAAASLLLTGYTNQPLDALDRLARFLRPRLDAIRDPAAKIRVLNHWLLKRNISLVNIDTRAGTLSYLPAVLGQDAGNCLGYSTLYLALAERLDLPLHGVLVPGHIFVRYDDGAFRRNIETTDLGSNIRDERYGALLARNREKRPVLSAILSNYSLTCRYYSDSEGAVLACERALQLDPTNTAALANYSLALYDSELHGRDRLLESVRRLREMVPSDPFPLLLAAQFHLDLGEPEQALEAAEEALRLEDSARTRAARALCLARLGRLEEARSALGSDLRDPAWRGAELEIELREEPARAQEIVAARMPEGDDALAMLSAAAEVLLDLDEADRALAVLDRGADAAARTLKEDFLASGGLVDPHSFHGVRQGWYLVRAKTLHALGRTGAARDALAKAEELGGSTRLLLEVRALLD